MKRCRWFVLCFAVLLTSCDSGEDMIPTDETEANPTEKPLSVPAKKASTPEKPKKMTELHKKLIGKWEATNDAGQKGTMEFTKDGNLILKLNGSESRMDWQYNVPNEKEVEFVGVVQGGTQSKKFPAVVKGKTLTITDRGKDNTFVKIK